MNINIIVLYNMLKNKYLIKKKIIKKDKIIKSNIINKNIIKRNINNNIIKKNINNKMIKRNIDNKMIKKNNTKRNNTKINNTKININNNIIKRNVIKRNIIKRNIIKKNSINKRNINNNISKDKNIYKRNVNKINIFKMNILNRKIDKTNFPEVTVLNTDSDENHNILRTEIEIISNVGFLIPIYPPHYHYIYNLINKLKRNNILVDINLVFSNKIDYDKFTMKNEIQPIICKPFQSKSIVTYKKFFGLKQLVDSKYDYIICCDSEIDILCNNFTNEIIINKIKQIFDNKSIFAGYTEEDLAKSVTQTSANLFPKNYNFLKNITNNFMMYFWWSDLPVYQRTDVNHFLNMINYNNIVWEHFDYIIYQYYLILYHEFKIINTTPITNIRWSLEHLITNDIDILNKLVDIKYGFSWNTKKMYNINSNFIDSQKGFLIYHLDR